MNAASTRISEQIKFRECLLQTARSVSSPLLSTYLKMKTHRTTTLSLVLHNCKTTALTPSALEDAEGVRGKGDEANV